ncbi:hypothetical protein ACFSX9_12650 [Flavobacterium ardleyense]|uniref:Uncharacterized protein n=1 Tax=Flavobacterium ardleyense TaxID=2038737 RepID=A0ABW5ZAQ9_9FLAO
MKNKLKITWFGEGIEYRKLELPVATLQRWEVVAGDYKKEFPAIIIDPFFFLKLKEENWDSLEVVPYVETIVLLPTPKNQIEIWFKKKKIAKLRIQDVLSQQTLFPLFKNNFKPFELEKGLHIKQKTIGQIASFEILLDFDFITFEDIEFQFVKIDDLDVLQGLHIKGVIIPFKKKDSNVVSQDALVIG